MGFLIWLGDKLLEIINSKNKVKVLVNEAFFDNNSKPFYFIKVTNLSAKNNFTITHIWIKDDSKEIDIINPLRPLPHKLELSDVWETWYPKNSIKDQVKIFKNFRVQLSNGKIYKSKRNFKIRPMGHVS